MKGHTVPLETGQRGALEVGYRVAGGGEAGGRWAGEGAEQV